MTAKTSQTRPSSLLGIDDEWLAYQLDSAVSFFGNVIEGASHEMEEVGRDDHKRLEPKYTMRQLLDPDFRLPRGDQPSDEDPLSTLKQMPGVRFHKVSD